MSLSNPVERAQFWFSFAMKLSDQLSEANKLVSSIMSALGTDETGDNLVSVARDAHLAEIKAGSIRRRIASVLNRYDRQIGEKRDPVWDMDEVANLIAEELDK